MYFLKTSCVFFKSGILNLISNSLFFLSTIICCLFGFSAYKKTSINLDFEFSKVKLSKPSVEIDISVAVVETFF